MATSAPFPFPPTYSFPPFFTPQPNPLTRSAQLTKWSSLIQSYCQHQRLFSLRLDTSTLESPLFHNPTIKRRLAIGGVREVLEFMTTPEGEGRAEWITTTATTSGSAGGDGPGEAWIWWRKPEEWASLVEKWVEETGQRGSVLTLYELTDGEGSEGQEWRGMGAETLKKVLGLCVKKGKAQVFGERGEEGVKFF